MTQAGQKSSVAIVTGASRGIGRATAEMLSDLGWLVALVARSEDALRETSRMVEGALILPVDISTPQAAQTIVERTIEHFGRIDALVNNAGLALMLPVEQTTDEIWQQTINTNLTAPFALCRAVWPVFRKQSAGVIVNVSSAAARDPFAGLIAYGAAKAGLNNLGLSLAREGARNNIRVHTIAPAATETEMFRGLPGMSDFPMGAAMEPADVARVIIQCITGELAHTSGEVIYLHKSPA